MTLTTPDPYPFKSIPLFKPKPWGGRKLEEIFHKPLPDGEKIGESWEAADIPEGASTIGNGSLREQSLSNAVQLWGKDLVGSRWDSYDRFPLLVKILDARENLSVQVHPDEESCEKFFPEHNSKDESWIVMESDPDGAIFRGFEKDVTLDDFLEKLEKNEVTEILRKIPVKKGDSVRNAPGTVHALLKGVVLLEVQEPSDSTFRIYDYGRKVDGKPRPLHIEEAKKVMKFDWEENPLLVPEKREISAGLREIIVNCDSYRLEKWTISQRMEMNALPETVRILFCMEGKAILKGDSEEIAVNPGDTIIIPAVCKNMRLSPDGTCAFCCAGAGNIELMK